MIVCIQSNRFSILAIFIISLLLCIEISSITSTDPNEENPVINQVDNQTDEYVSSQLHENVLTDSNSESILPQIIENDVPIISIENKSEVIDETPPLIVSPLATENQTNDEQQPIKKNDSQINSFEEWKQQQLLAESLKKGETATRNSVSSEQSSPSSPSANIQQIPLSSGLSKKGKLRKNFASASCGAKILAHNTEAQNVGSILSSSQDEYMLNPCNAKIWFVIELCESIRILNIEIANFELFSSVPKTFRVSASDRYPTKDWHRHHLGTFNATFNRTIQSFQPLLSTIYLKYIKFELLDFHGHEHYCPLSVVRIHGSNVEDEIMIMEENTNLNELNPLLNIHDENDNENDEDNNLSDQQVGGIIGSAIIDLAKRVFRRQTIHGTQSTTTIIPTIETNVLKPDCHSTNLNNLIFNENIHLLKHTDKLKQCIAKFLQGLWFKFDTCTIYLSQICFKLNYCCQCSLKIIKKQKTLNLYRYTCGYYHLLTSQFICKQKQFINLNKTLTTNIQNETIQNINENNNTIEKDDDNNIIIIDENTNILNNQSILMNLTNNLLNETQNQSNEQISLNNISNETIIIPEPQISLNTTDESSSSQSIVSESINIDLNMTESVIDINNTDEIIPTTTTTTSTLNNNNNIEPIPSLISSPWLKGMLVNTKSLPELFKIIEKLNFNLTLSNRYLQELSQHYVKKLDETQQTTDQLLKSSKAADEKLLNFEEQLYKLQENYIDISNRLIKVEAWIPLIICIIMCLFIWCISSTCRLIRLKRKFKNLLQEFEEIKKLKQIEDEDEDNKSPIRINGFNKKRRSSTDSNDSNPTRSQRVPDLPLSKKQENGLDKIEHKLNETLSNSNHT